ncbi:MAG: type I glutamate--ammonia ligase [Myxococcales bacterium]|nr:type I glutamate--ammonia ligase [Myxococcales bacterium]
MTPKDVIKFAKDHGAKMLDIKFVDFIGQWQHFGITGSHLEEGLFEDGLGFDGSSIRGWQPIDASDMLVLPDPETAKMDPFTKVPTLSLIANIADPITREPYTRDPRHIAKKVVKYLQASGIADTAYIGPEAEFFMFDDVRYEQSAHRGFYQVDSDEAAWNTARDEAGSNLGYKLQHKAGYFPVSPSDTLDDIRVEMVLQLEALGITIEAQHHEVATAGQCEIDMRFEELVKMADQCMWYKYVIKNVAKRHGKTVTFMPKPIYGDNGSGMHTHVSLWKNGDTLFAGDKYAGMSEMALHFIGGLLKHARAVCAFANPTTNSYRRLVPGYEAPINLAYSSRNRSASVRIPMYSPSPKAKRLEFRTPDPSCNPYLSFAAILMAGLDGIENRIDPGEPLDKNIYALPAEEAAKVGKTPFTLFEALESLREDHEFLLRGDVFTEDVVKGWIDFKMEEEVKPMLLRPTPYEFALYYDC